jgi:o-succinylbenzoate synthase
MTSRRRLGFSLDLRHPVLGLTRREGWLLEGSEGWGEWSPLPSWSRDETLAAFAAAVEAAGRPFPPPVQEQIDINSMVPRLTPELAADLAVASGCATVKVKVGDADGEARVRAVREAVGGGVRIRLDANGAWDVFAAGAALRRLADLDIELVEDPVATLPEMRELRRTSPTPLAAEMSVRSLEDLQEFRRLEAADALVIKPQRMGGIRASLRAAESVSVPVIVSSALETSVGLAAALAVAAALPHGPFAHGIGTAALLAGDVTSTPLLPENGRLRPRRVLPDLLLSEQPVAG